MANEGMKIFISKLSVKALLLSRATKHLKDDKHYSLYLKQN